jgi:hypothetical protein
MKVECFHNTGKGLPVSYFSLGYSSESQFDIEVGSTYSVYGMCLWKGCLQYLINPDVMPRPNWYPAILFEVRDKGLPESWQFSFLRENEEHGVVAVWGYRELVNSTAHFEGLLERERLAIDVFAKRRMETEVVG